MMTSKFSPIVAMLLLAGAEITAPSAAMSAEAKAATLDSAVAAPMHVRCFMGETSDRPNVPRDSVDLHRGWFCMQEQVPALAH